MSKYMDSGIMRWGFVTVCCLALMFSGNSNATFTDTTANYICIDARDNLACSLEALNFKEFPLVARETLLKYPVTRIKEVVQRVGGYYQMPVGGAYISPIDGYAVVGLSRSEDGFYTMLLVEFEPDKPMRCTRNNLYPEYLWQWYYDYSGECNG